MANNPYVNKVIYGGTTVMDISDSDVQESDVANGKVFYKGNGARSVGTGVSGDYVTEPELRDTVGWTGKNLYKIPIYVTTRTESGITFTITRNADGEIVEIDVDGTATANALLTLWSSVLSGDFYNTFPNEDVILSGCPSGGASDTYRLDFIVVGDSTKNILDTGDGVTIPKNWATGVTNEIASRVRVQSGTTCNHLKFYPMLRYASISDDTYEPYHASVKQTLRDSEVIEGKNLLPFPYKEGTKTLEGVTFTVNTDGSVTANGTATNTSYIYLFQNEVHKMDKECILNGCPANGSDNTYKIIFKDETTGVYYEDKGDGIVIPSYVNTHTITSYIRIGSGTTVNNLTFYPMLRYATESDPTYEPYYIPLKDSKFDRSEQRVLGAKNLLPYPYYRESGWVNRGITFTYSEEGKLIANGTSSESNLDSFCTVYYNNTLESGTYTVSGCPSGGSSSTYWIHVFINGADTGRDYGNGYTFTYTKGDTLDIQVRIARNGYVANNVTFKPMLRLASDPDDTYVPYAMTNKELTDIVKNVPQEIVRTGVTATAGTAVRIPASGTDSRISTANTCVVKPISEAKSDGTPYKYRSCKVYSGYVEITYAENISNIAVGVEVVNY